MSAAASKLTLTSLALVLAGCAGWHTVESGAEWRLLAGRGAAVDADEWRGALTVAARAVEQAFDSFRRPVAVHVLDDERALPARGEHQAVLEAPGFGPARVRAVHTRGAGGPFGWSSGRGGVFAREPEVGVLVHELVHARLAELAPDLPRWLEEGLATWLGDGVRDGERWVVDGLAAWPLAELRGARPSAAEIERVLRLERGQRLEARDELLVHFVGWAAVHDLACERPTAGPRAWLSLLRAEPLATVRARVEQSFAEGVELTHLEQRLAAEDPALRRAAALGSWKLASQELVELLARALERETDAEARAVLAVNLISAAGVLRTRASWRRAVRAALPVLAEIELDDAEETRALRELGRYTRRPWAQPRGEELLARLERLWRE